MANWGAFAGGLATGIVTGTDMARRSEKDKRDKELHDLQKENAELDLTRKRSDEEARRMIEDAGRAAFQEALGGTHGPVDETEGLSTVTPPNPFGERGAMIAGAEAMANAAMKAGKMDVAHKHLEGAAAMRTRIRGEMAGDALKRARAGDFSALSKFYDLVPDGDALAGGEITKDDKGQPVYSFNVNSGGKTKQITLTDEQLVKHVTDLADPVKGMEIDLRLGQAKALEKWKWDNNPEVGLKKEDQKEKTRHNQALERLKGEEIAAIRDYRRSTLQLRADAAGRRGQPTPKDINTLIDKGGLGFRKLIEAEQSKEDAKLNPNAMLSLLPSMQAELGGKIRGGDDPEVAFETTFYRYKDLVGSVNDSLSNALADADKAWGRDSKLERLKTNLSKIMEEKGLSREEMVKFSSATKVGSSNPLVRQALSGLPKAKPISGAPGLEPKQPPSAPAAAPAAAPSRPRADAFFQ